MDLLLLIADPGPHSMLPALSLLGHGVGSAAPEVAALLDAGSYDAVFVPPGASSCAARRRRAAARISWMSPTGGSSQPPGGLDQLPGRDQVFRLPLTAHEPGN